YSFVHASECAERKVANDRTRSALLPDRRASFLNVLPGERGVRAKRKRSLQVSYRLCCIALHEEEKAEIVLRVGVIRIESDHRGELRTRQGDLPRGGVNAAQY